MKARANVTLKELKYPPVHNFGSWEEARDYAKRRIKELEYLLRVFNQKIKNGEPWPERQSKSPTSNISSFRHSIHIESKKTNTGWNTALREVDKAIVAARQQAEQLERVKVNWEQLRESGMPWPGAQTGIERSPT
jgi:hypothetical protein